MAEKVIWGIHGGRTGDADTLFRERNVIAVGWKAAGDLSKVAGDRDAFSLDGFPGGPRGGRRPRPRRKIQVKSSEGKVGDPEVSALYGKVGSDEYGLLVTLGPFTPQAKQFARSKSNLRLIDSEELVELVLAHYDALDSKFKSIIPLRRVYVPEPPEEEG